MYAKQSFQARILRSLNFSQVHITKKTKLWSHMILNEAKDKKADIKRMMGTLKRMQETRIYHHI